jgi:uncharacterized protein YraI
MLNMIKQVMFALILVVCLVVAGAAPAAARQETDAYTLVILNMRAGPGTGFALLVTLDLDTALILEARNADTSWVLGHTLDGGQRGWFAAIYLRYGEGFTPARLPVGDEVIAPTAPPSAPAQPAAVFTGALPARVRDIFLQGQTMGNNPHAFVKVGDCNSDSDAYLKGSFMYGQVDLGPYADLQATIDFFAESDSFRYFNVSASPGFSILSVMDPMYRDQQYCHDLISPLECDFSLLKPAVVFIMPMAGDVYGLTDYQYAAGVRAVVDFSLSHGVIPVLITFPVSEREAAINGTLRAAAQEYGVPLIDFASAAAGLPDRGLVPGDTVHLSGPNLISFNGDQDRYGFTLLNLLTLQTLDQLRGVMN